MIKLILSGGLGNQMFQYAAGRALSLRLQTDLSLDQYKLRKKSDATFRNFGLDAFDVQASMNSSLVNKLIVKGFKLLKGSDTGKSILSSLEVFCDQKAQEYDVRIKNLSPNTTLLGYFQNENYFREFSEQIRKDFTFTKKLDPRNEELKLIMERSNSVSVHIRRGDYTHTNSNLQVLDISYYQRAIKYMKAHVGSPSFFVFSDDVDWVRKHLNIDNYNYVYVDWNKAESGYIDMQLMSLCKHNIIANSSFSWWGAWLNANTRKTVVAPSVWYKDEVAGNYPKGFIPLKWLIL